MRAVERDGVLYVQDGQLRTLAAREAARTTIPVYVVPDIEGTDKARTADRIITQWNSNEQREAMTARDKAEAVQQLSLAGVSATKIAKATHLHKKDIDATLATAQSRTAMDALEFGAGRSDGGSFGSVVAQVLGAALELLVAAVGCCHQHGDGVVVAVVFGEDRGLVDGQRLEAQGVGILDRRPYRSDERDGVYAMHRIVDLSTGQRPDIEDVPISSRAAFVIAVDTTTWTDSDGNPVDPEHIDFDVLDDGPDAEVEEGQIDPRGLTEHPAIDTEIDWYIHNLDSADTLVTVEDYRASQPTTTDGKAKASAADIAAAEAAAKEQQRQERRMVRELNKQMVAATEVRRAKLTEILARKTLPKGKAAAIAAFIADTMLNHHDLFGLNNSQGDAAALATELLGSTAPREALADAKTADRTQMIALAIVAGAHEAAMWKDSWRGNEFGWVGRAPWLRFLGATLGHELADVEKVIVGEMKAADVAID